MESTIRISVRYLPLFHVAIDTLVANQPEWTAVNQALCAPDGIKVCIYASGMVSISNVPSEQHLNEVLAVLNAYAGAPTRSHPYRGRLWLSTITGHYDCGHPVHVGSINPNAFTSVRNGVFRTEKTAYRIESDGRVTMNIKAEEDENVLEAFYQAKAFIEPLIN